MNLGIHFPSGFHFQLSGIWLRELLFYVPKVYCLKLNLKNSSLGAWSTLACERSPGAQLVLCRPQGPLPLSFPVLLLGHLTDVVSLHATAASYRFQSCITCREGVNGGGVHHPFCAQHFP